MTREQIEKAVTEMEKLGGSFAKNLAHLWRIADSENKARIEIAWQDLFSRYVEKESRYVAHIHWADGCTTVITNVESEEVADPETMFDNRYLGQKSDVEYIEIVECSNTVASWSNPNCSPEQPFR